MPVEMVTRKMRNDGDERGLIVYGYKFRPSTTNYLSINNMPLMAGRGKEINS